MVKKTSGSILLEVNNIEVVYNDIVQVLRGVSLEVTEGSIVALLGTNGAGKTTTLRAISGLLKPENGFIKDGRITFHGKDITKRPSHKVAAAGIGRTFQNVRIFPEMTVLENVMLGRHLRGKAGLFSAFLKLPSERKEEKDISEYCMALLDDFPA